MATSASIYLQRRDNRGSREVDVDQARKDVQRHNVVQMHAPPQSASTGLELSNNFLKDADPPWLSLWSCRHY